MKQISSKSNEYYKHLQSLIKNKDKGDEVLVEGLDVLLEAHLASRLKAIITHVENTNKLPEIYESYEKIILSRELYRNLASYQSLPAFMGLATLGLSEELPLDDLVYLDCLQDPGNVGTIIRTAFALGYKGVILSKDSASFRSSKVIQASRGAVFSLPIVSRDLLDIENIKDYTVIGTSLKGSKVVGRPDSEKPIIIIMGNEGHGMSSRIEGACDYSYYLPITNIDSLNVGVAAGIFMYILGRNYGS